MGEFLGIAEEHGPFFLDLVSNKNVPMLNNELGCGDVNFIHIFCLETAQKIIFGRLMEGDHIDSSVSWAKSVLDLRSTVAVRQGNIVLMLFLGCRDRICYYCFVLKCWPLGGLSISN